MYRRGETGQVVRALRLLDALRGFRRGRTFEDLARVLGCSQRTVRRYLADLVDADLRVELCLIENRAAARLIDTSYSTIAITRRERYTLLAVRGLFDVLAGTPLAEDVTSVLTKLEQRMSAEERAEHEALGDRFAYLPDGGTKIYTGKEDVLDAILTGVLQRKLVKYAYQGAKGRVKRGYLAPYAVVLHKNGLYCLGATLRDPADVDALADRGFTVFAAERFTEADHVRRAHFTVPATFKLSSVMHNAFDAHVSKPDVEHHVMIGFTKERATYARARLWHKNQQIEERPDGSIVIRFTTSSLVAVVSWVLSWGPHATALEPPALVAAIVSDMDAARSKYLR